MLPDGCGGMLNCGAGTLPPECNGVVNADCDDFPEDCDELCCPCKPASCGTCPNSGDVLCNGVCTNAVTDPTHCGACDGVCATTQTCVAGVCQ